MNKFLFPLDNYVDSFLTKDSCKFGAQRDNGERLHAGIDLLTKEKESIIAIWDGIVVENPSLFFAKTYQIVIDHGFFLARYCEINPLPFVKKGATVKAGEKIAEVIKSSINTTMLHLEIYTNKEQGSLTQKNNKPFLRRNDLLNPTFLIKLCHLKKEVFVWVQK